MSRRCTTGSSHLSVIHHIQQLSSLLFSKALEDHCPTVSRRESIILLRWHSAAVHTWSQPTKFPVMFYRTKLPSTPMASCTVFIYFVIAVFFFIFVPFFVQYIFCQWQFFPAVSVCRETFICVTNEGAMLYSTICCNLVSNLHGTCNTKKHYSRVMLAFQMSIRFFSLL